MHLVIYHSPCYDGMSSAWCFHRFKDEFYEDIEFRGMNYHEAHTVSSIPIEDYTELFIVDFSFDPDSLLDLCKRIQKKVTLLDHHQTAIDKLSDLSRKRNKKLHIELDADRAGCQITWDYLSQRFFNEHVKRPQFLDYVADRDLWRWKLPFSREVNKMMGDTRSLSSFEKMDTLAQSWYSHFNTFRKQGRDILRYEESMIRKIVYASATLCMLDTPDGQTYSVFVVESPILMSEIGHSILKWKGTPEHDIVLIWRYTPETQLYHVSVRSTQRDITPLCRAMGGGGHPHAGGFTCTSLPIRFVSRVR